MALLIILQGPDVGRKFHLNEEVTVLGRQPESSICLPARAVSREHARISRDQDGFFVEDLDSSNGTFLNNKRLPIRQPVPLTERDTLQVGPYYFALRPAPTLTPTEPNLVIREQVSVASMTQSVYGQDPAQKLKVVLELAQHLARTLDLEALLDKLLDHLMQLMPQADRALVLLCEGKELVVRGQRCRHQQDATTYPYSRTVVRRALDEGVGILSDDIQSDQRFQSSQTLTALDMRSLMCVPVIGQEGRRLGVIQLDRFRQGQPFRSDDLHLLTAVSLQVGVVLENAALHSELLRKERQDQELALARDIQQSYLPGEFAALAKAGIDLYACVHPARDMAGDLYDFFLLPDGRLAFFVGDVVGKGMPAALFTVTVHVLGRHLAKGSASPAATLLRLNSALAADNPSELFVTLIHGIYDPRSGEVVFTSGGHPMPLLRRADGTVAEVTHRSGRLLGLDEEGVHLTDRTVTLQPGELLVCYTDGYTEARLPQKRTLFGLPRLQEVVRGFEPGLVLPECADRARAAVAAYIGGQEQQDDLTLLLLRRR
jgi:serine phosphatase RsbU (regulator of sigma subunit)